MLEVEKYKNVNTVYILYFYDKYYLFCILVLYNIEYTVSTTVQDNSTYYITT